MMSTGTRKVRMPSPFHFGRICSYAPIALFCVRRPMAMSDVSSVKPNVSTRIK